MVLIGFLIILLPVFIVVSVRTKMVTKLWAKIVITCISVISIIVSFAYSDTLSKLEESNTTLDYVIDRDTSYLDCVNNEDNIDNIIDYCVIPLTKELSEIYDNE